MNISDIAKQIGESVITHQHETFKKRKDDDLTHIINLSVTISGISSFLKENKISKNEINEVASCLKNIAKELFIKHCVGCRDAEFAQETEEEFIEDTDDYFDYIFKNKKHPY